MKKLLLILLALMMCVSMCACGTNRDNTNNESIAQDDSSSADYVSSNESSQNEFDNSSEEDFESEYSEEYDSGERWLGNRTVQYNEADEQYVVFFSFSKEQNSTDYISEKGVANIIIKDSGGYIVFDKDINFSASDFSSWTNQSWDTSRYMCGLYINRSDIAGCASSSGTLELTVRLANGSRFATYNMSIYDLPPISVDIELPQLPANYTDSRYSYTQSVEVSSIEYSSQSYSDGTATVTLKAKITLKYKSKNTNESSSVHVGYKLYNSEGIVVASDQISSTSIAVGETTIATESIYDLDPRESYTLVLMDAS